MPNFIDSFSAAFTPAYQNSLRSWQDQQNADREFGLKKRAADQQAELTGLQIGAQRRVDAADSALTEGLTKGVLQTAPSTDPDQDGFSTSYRPASDRERLNLRTAAAVARGQDTKGLEGERQKLDIDDAAAANIKKLADDPTYWPELSKNINLNHKRVTIDNGTDAKSGKQVRAPSISIVKDDGTTHAIPITEAHKKQLALAMAHIDNKDVAGGLAIMAGVDKHLADAAHQEITEQTNMFGANTKAAHEFNTDQHNQRMEGLRQQEIGVQRDRFNHERSQAQGVGLNFRAGPDGSLTPVMTGLRFNQKTGQYDSIESPINQAGIIPAHALQPENLARIASGLVGQKIPGVVGPDGKPAVFDPITAQQAAVKQVISQYSSPAKPTADPNVAKMFGGGQSQRFPPAGAPAAPAAGLQVPSGATTDAKAPWSAFPEGSGLEMLSRPYTAGGRGAGWQYNGQRYPTEAAAREAALRTYGR